MVLSFIQILIFAITLYACSRQTPKTNAAAGVGLSDNYDAHIFDLITVTDKLIENNFPKEYFFSVGEIKQKKEEIAYNNFSSKKNLSILSQRKIKNNPPLIHRAPPFHEVTTYPMGYEEEMWVDDFYDDDSFYYDGDDFDYDYDDEIYFDDCNERLPYFTCGGFYSEQEQKDPRTNQTTASLQDYGAGLELTYPASDCFVWRARAANQYVILRNLVTHNTIYSISVKRASLGFFWDYSDCLSFCCDLGYSYFSRHHNSEFDVGNGLRIEPSLIMHYEDDVNTIIVDTLADSSTISRNFARNQAKLISRQFVDGYYSYDFGLRRSVGIFAGNGWYDDRVENKEQVLAAWVQLSPPCFWENFVARYQFNYGNFTHAIPDYYTFKDQKTHWLMFELSHQWCDRFCASIEYAHGWQRSFDQGVVIVIDPLTPFRHVHRNINQVLGHFTANITDCIDLNIDGNYYRDSLDYRAWSISSTLDWSF